MTILQANFKHLYQRRGFWVIDLLLAAGVALGAVGAVAGELHPVLICAAFMYVAGMFIAAMQVEVLAKPFSYCLPGHERVPARLLFVVGLCLAMVWAAIWLVHARADWEAALVTSVSAFFASTVVYWAGVWFVFRFQNWAGAIGLIVLVVVLAGFLGIEGLVARLLLEGWLFVVAAGCAVNIAAWWLLSRNGLSRRYCGRMWMGALDPWNKERMTKFSQARMAQKKAFCIRPEVERFFLGRIRGGSPVMRYVWGNWYKAGAGVMASRRKEWVPIVLAVLAMVCFLGYMGPGVSIVFIMPPLIVMHMQLGVHSSMLVAGGRKERFWSALVLALVTAVLVTAAVTLAAVISVFLQPVMPELTIRGQGAVYRAMEVRLFFVPVAMVPLTLTFGLVFYRYPRLMLGAAMVLFMVLFQLLMIGRHIPDVAVAPAIAAAVIVVGCWATFTAVLWYICMRRCLVR